MHRWDFLGRGIVVQKFFTSRDEYAVAFLSQLGSYKTKEPKPPPTFCHLVNMVIKGINGIVTL